MRGAVLLLAVLLTSGCMSDGDAERVAAKTCFHNGGVWIRLFHDSGDRGYGKCVDPKTLPAGEVLK